MIVLRGINTLTNADASRLDRFSVASIDPSVPRASLNDDTENGILSLSVLPVMMSVAANLRGDTGTGINGDGTDSAV